MWSTDVPISSEVSGLINFFVCELFIMGYVLYATTLIAGALNYQVTNKGNDLQFTVFDLPHIGGGLVMNRSFSRTILILIRLSTLVAVTVSSFGLEGRTRTTTALVTGMVRRPGVPPLDSYEKFFQVTELRKRCARTREGSLIFGTVVDGACYPTATDSVYIRSISMNFTVFNYTATDCVETQIEQFHLTTYECNKCDIACFGISEIEHGRCKSLIYESDTVSWMCPSRSARPGIPNEEVHCQRLEAKAEDMKLWLKVYKVRTENIETAIFGAAYGVEEKKTVEVPDGQQNVTSVTLFWIIPVIFEIFIVLVTSLWALSLRLGGAFPIANDERSLSKLLRHWSDIGDRKVSPAEYRTATREVQAMAFRTEEPSRADDLT